MILGIGTDLCRIDRIENTLLRFGDRFRMRCYTEFERMQIKRRGQTREASRYAQLFAAKEATTKALGTGLRQGVAWRQIEIRHLKTGQPTIQLTGPAKDRMDKLTPAGFRAELVVSLTDDLPFAHAVVIIYAVAEGTPIFGPDLANQFLDR